ncbi:hypothetical protein BDC45DRAFT_530812 [Circinella umbellata]|nr:hypothetical protein BDC45DRAFT_530812 [Circinella umbellata]
MILSKTLNKFEQNLLSIQSHVHVLQFDSNIKIFPIDNDKIYSKKDVMKNIVLTYDVHPQCFNLGLTIEPLQPKCLFYVLIAITLVYNRFKLNKKSFRKGLTNSAVHTTDNVLGSKATCSVYYSWLTTMNAGSGMPQNIELKRRRKCSNSLTRLYAHKHLEITRF